MHIKAYATSTVATLRRHRSRTVATIATATAATTCLVALGPGFVASATPKASAPKPTIVLVHGDWADGSSWSKVAERLQARGYTVLVPPNQLRGPAEDSAYLASFLTGVAGPIVLVGHSYGGFVITDAAPAIPNVKALVYVDAYIPNVGDTVLSLSTGSCLNADPTKAFRPVPYPGGADLYLQVAPDPPYLGFQECFADGVDPHHTAFLAADQRPAAASSLGEPSGAPGWTSIPSWSLIGTNDRVIPPARQQFMSSRAHAHIATVGAGHLSLITKPEAVTDVILSAVNTAS